VFTLKAAAEHLRSLDLWAGRGHEAALLSDVNGKGFWLTPKTGERSGYPVASASLSRSRSGVGGPAGAPDALNELMGLHRPVGRCGRVVSSVAGG
jgi:hypothetical protein